MSDDPTMATDPAERARLAHQMEHLREMIAEGEIGEREGDRQYGQMARRLIGDRAFDEAVARRRERQSR